MSNFDLFSDPDEFDIDKKTGPLADRMRPESLNQFVGQGHLVSKGKFLRRMIENDQLQSLILWGPPGSGKTTMAHIIAHSTDHNFTSFSAVFSGIKSVRAVMEQSQSRLRIYGRKTIIFIDEIHRFNKAQQDAFLPFVEKGDIILIGATTENPSFEVNSALLSRCRVLVLHALNQRQIGMIIKQALDDDKNGLGTEKLNIDEDAILLLSNLANGDARAALTTLEIAYQWTKIEEEKIDRITVEMIKEAYQKKTLRYDKTADQHYNLISALHKSLRGSHPDAALYWMVRMLEGGEDPLYVARRMIRFASEDIGNADPNALTVAIAARDAYHTLGSPEGELALAQAAIYLATAPKSNSIYAAYRQVTAVIKKTGNLPVPLHILNAPTRLMKSLDYGKGYQYDHDCEDNIAPQECLPREIRDEKFYEPSRFGFEKEIKKRLGWWEKKRSNVTFS